MMSLEDFLSCGLLLLDNDIQERVQKASLEGKVLRYVCVIEGPRYSMHSFFIVIENLIVSEMSPFTCQPSVFSELVSYYEHNFRTLMCHLLMLYILCFGKRKIVLTF